MHAHQLILKTVLNRIQSDQRILHLASCAASAAAFRQELALQQSRLDRMESELLQIAEQRGWEFKPAIRLFPEKVPRNADDSLLAETLIRRYTETLIPSLKLLHRLPYPDAVTEAAIDRIRDGLIGCIMRLLTYL